VAVLLSALLWVPFVGSLTRSSAELTGATERIDERAEELHRPCLGGLRTEAQEMSQLVNELLSLSKAGLKPADIRSQPLSTKAKVEVA